VLFRKNTYDPRTEIAVADGWGIRDKDGDSTILRVAMIGFGNVAQEFSRLLLAKKEWLARQKGLEVEVLAVSTRSRGSLLSKRGLDLEKVLSLAASGGSLVRYGTESTSLSPIEIIRECDADVLIELSTLNIESGQPGIDHIKMAMNSGLDVITANKGPVAFAYKELRNLARSRGVHFRFEGTVMDGTPVFSLVERTLPGCTVTGLRGVLNSTSNFVLTEMANGLGMQDAIALAQKNGFAEADPSLDIDGWDAAAKIAALANVMMDAGSNPRKVKRTGIRDITREDLSRAAAEGKRIRHIARARLAEGGVDMEVKPERVGADDFFYALQGTSSAVTITSDLMGDITIAGGSPMLAQTAYAVFSDLLLVLESIRAGTL
jgi:homoserine dehydrogenase